MKPTHLPFLTGVRGVAAAAVAVRHLHGDVRVLEDVAHLAVYLFFVLSALLLTLRGLERLPAPGRRGAFWRGYAVRRVFRVYPLYLVATVALFAATLLRPSITRPLDEIHGGFSFWGQATMVDPLRTLFWTIPLEFEFYLVVPFVVLAASRWPRASMAVLGAVALGWSFLRDPGETLYDPHLLSGALLPVFLVGSASGILVHRVRSGGGWDGSALPLRLRWGIYLGALAATVLLFPEVHDPLVAGGLFGDTTYKTMPVLVPALLMCAVLVPAILAPPDRDPVARTFSLGPLREAGLVSYSVYITHPVAIGLVLGFQGAVVPLPAPVELVVFALAAWGVARLTYMAVERSAMGWGRVLSQRASARLGRGRGAALEPVG